MPASLFSNAKCLSPRAWLLSSCCLVLYYGTYHVIDTAAQVRTNSKQKQRALDGRYYLVPDCALPYCCEIVTVSLDVLVVTLSKESFEIAVYPLSQFSLQRFIAASVSSTMSQAEFNKRLKVLMQKPENQICSDCPERQPRWASLVVPPPGSPPGTLPMGAFCCLECSGSHRRLGVHISFVRSITLDSCK
jgi:stromal membrane-associated protein